MECSRVSVTQLAAWCSGVATTGGRAGAGSGTIYTGMTDRGTTDSRTTDSRRVEP